ncbi:MAG: hypothetical protein QN157_08735 [Armatimonadota bacterium]|nr:hypothetical protein [Armatimonadota bacterium]
MKRDARRLLERAWRAFLGARMVARPGNADLVAVLAFLAMETAARALLVQHQISWSSSDDVREQFARWLASGSAGRRTGGDARRQRWLQWLLDAHDACIQAELAIDSRLSDAAARTLIDRARTMVQEIRDELLWATTERYRLPAHDGR